ncbi:prolipoprotein diacylglyceryl transferase [Candidatus Ichthyocystis hellenicum]|uniref:prolipoprotein diacylglyceryl transferase n=1 Tax=Candidatus Ichthyocystis hellenicum TaxID=1561003 RepID=UPI000A83BDC4|nr:prolipoprotein diacylglyceryl transferase [Candidatus Ichthyocystis hellenicum]
MFIHPNIDPVALHLGPVKVYWYGIMYFLGFLCFMSLSYYRKRFPHYQWVTSELIDTMVLYGVLGVVVGGRLGEVILYRPFHYWQHPSEIIKVWHGGMSFHGGLAGVIISVVVMSYRHNLEFIKTIEFVAPSVIPGYAMGRIGNFINSELVGRATNVPWATIFPRVDNIPRHPSQIYQAGIDGVLLFIVMWVFTLKPRPRCATSGLYLVGYAVTRSFTEMFRVPDGTMPIKSLGISISMGQYYCIPLFIGGIGMLSYAYLSPSNSNP